MKKQLWNDNWSFTSDIENTPVRVDLPHDAMQAEKRVPGLKDGSGTGYYPGGTYTYVKKLFAGSELMEQTVLLEFEGIYMKSSVFLNGQPVGGHIYGYTDFFVDLTGKLKNGENEIKVIADNSQFPNSRWYSGSGIYRDVVLHTAGREYICPDGIKVLTLSTDPAQIQVTVASVKDPDTEIRVRVLKNGEIITDGSGNDLVLTIPEAKLWSADSPELYEIHAALAKDGFILDEATDCFGIRKLSWDSVNGFQVNGNTVKLRGGCVHHDHAFIGTAEYEAACLRKVRIMKEAGFNAVRISHHPASRAMLKACDALGLYVMNETFDTWLGLKNPYDYAMYFEQEWRADVEAMIRVSYNHPSVVMYSIGNEVYLKDIAKTSEITKAMTDLCHEKDASRAVINALNPMTVIMGNSKNPKQNQTVQVENPRIAAKNSGLVGSRLANTMISALPVIMKIFGNEGAMKKRNSVMEPLDIVGFNYADYLYDVQHADYPDRVLCGSETFPKNIARNWQGVLSRPWVIGDFLWTAWDYLGESGAGTVGYGKAEAFTQPFPVICAGVSNIDLTGEITCQGYYTAIVYGQYKKPYIAVHPAEHAGEKVFTGQWRFTDAIHSWTWRGHEGKTLSVDVYANADQVELIQDGHSLGRKATENCLASFLVPYGSGTLKAISYDSTGHILGEDVLTTAGTEAMLCLKPESTQLKEDRQKLLYLPIEITDAKGVRQIRMDREVTVQVEGPAELIGIGNASMRQDSLTPYRGNRIAVYEGRALAILRTKNGTGSVRITVSAEGLESRTIELN